MRAGGAYRPEAGSQKGDAMSAAHKAALETNINRPKPAGEAEKTFGEEDMFDAQLDALMDAKLKEFKANPAIGEDLRKMTWRKKVEDALIAAEIEKMIAGGKELTPEVTGRIKADVAERMAKGEAEREEKILQGPEQYDAGNYKAA